MNAGPTACKAFWGNVEESTVKWKETWTGGTAAVELHLRRYKKLDNERSYEIDDVTIASMYVCGNCSYYYIDKCHRYPPSHGFPYVRDDDWCGKFNFKQ